jgi:hypothetical protein
MTKQEYLKRPIVNNFIEWLKKCDNDYKHSYFNRRSKKKWICKSLDDAFKRYNWSFKNSEGQTKFEFSDNENELNMLSENIKEAYKNKNIDNLFQYSSKICKWGGVLGGVKFGNLKTLIKNKSYLFEKYKKTEIVMSSDTANDEKLGDIFNMNAGFTKIYSLLFDKLIIYDSRVGAALCLLVKDFCSINGISKIPNELKFGWSKAKEDKYALNPKNRNPGKVGEDEFPDFNSRHKSHIHSKSMLRASWLIEKFITSTKGKDNVSKKMREFEAALFMIGYDLPIKSEEIKNKYQFKTKKKNIFFDVIIDDVGIKIISIKSNFEFKFKQLEDIKTELKENFKYNKFPLAVNGTKISKNKEELGLGIILKRITKKSHHAASYLGPFLEEIGVLENHKEIEKSKNTITYWKVNKNNYSITIKQLIEEYY